jgi:hypothetical protein
MQKYTISIQFYFKIGMVQTHKLKLAGIILMTIKLTKEPKYMMKYVKRADKRLKCVLQFCKYVYLKQWH